MIALTELIWGAGFWDGEGCCNVRLGHRGRRAYPQMQLAQVDRRPLDRFAKIARAKVRGPYFSKNPKSNPHYRLSVDGDRNYLILLNTLWPWLSPPKREQGLAVIKRIEAFRGQPMT